LISASSASWARHIGIVDRQIQATGAFVAGADFSLADIPVALSINRWFSTPLQHPRFPAVSDYFERLAKRPGFLAYCRNGSP
jgi:glutathione S-transferase